MELVRIFSTQTLTGLFIIEAESAAFRISNQPLGNVYELRNDRFPEFARFFSHPCEAICAVSEHRTGLLEWDQSPEKVSDYAGDWVREDNKRFRMKLLTDFLDSRPGSCLRSLVDYFEVRHGYFLDRIQIRELLEELIMNGDLKELPNMHLAPAEMHMLDHFAKQWLRPTGDKS